MPWAQKRPCTVPRCPEFQPCPVHARKPFRRSDNTRYPRTSSKERGYSDGWTAARKRALVACDFRCNRCGERAVVVHHITPITGPDDPMRLEPSNLECLCRPCHERHHGRAK